MNQWRIEALACAGVDHSRPGRRASWPLPPGADGAQGPAPPAGPHRASLGAPGEPATPASGAGQASGQSASGGHGVITRQRVHSSPRRTHPRAFADRFVPTVSARAAAPMSARRGRLAIAACSAAASAAASLGRHDPASLSFANPFGRAVVARCHDGNATGHGFSHREWRSIFERRQDEHFRSLQHRERIARRAPHGQSLGGVLVDVPAAPITRRADDLERGAVAETSASPRADRQSPSADRACPRS